MVEDCLMDSDKKEGSVIDGKIIEIKKLTQDILDLGADISKNATEIKEKMRTVISLVSFVISYPNPNLETIKNPLIEFSQNVFTLIDSHPEQKDSIMTYLRLFGGFANNLVDAMAQKKA